MNSGTFVIKLKEFVNLIFHLLLKFKCTRIVFAVISKKDDWLQCLIEQDFVVSMKIELNMSDQTAQKLRNENKELIDRWMASKRREADEMNAAFRE